MASNGYIGHMPWADRHEGSGESDLAKRFRVICGQRPSEDSVGTPAAGKCIEISSLFQEGKQALEMDGRNGESGDDSGSGKEHALFLSDNSVAG